MKYLITSSEKFKIQIIKNSVDSGHKNGVKYN